MPSESQDVFEVGCRPKDVEAAPGRTARITCEITNRSDRGRDVGLKVLTDEPDERSWYEIDESGRARLEPGQSHETTLGIRIPEDLELGRYEVAVVAYDREEPDEVFTEGPRLTVFVRAESTVVPSKPPWWIFVAVGVVVLTIVGATLAIVLDDDEPPPPPPPVAEPEPPPPPPVVEPPPPPPDVGDGLTEVPSIISLTVSQAELNLQARDLVGSPRRQLVVTPVEHVTAQDLPAGDRVEPGTVVGYTVAAPAVEVPDVSGMKPEDARSRIGASGLASTVVERKVDELGKEPTVVEQSPTAGSVVPSGSTVTVTYEHCTLEERTVSQSITLGPSDAKLIAQDWDVYPDDWTGVEVSYEIEESSDHKRLDMTVTMDVRELDPDKQHRGGTHIRTSKTFRVLTLGSEEVHRIEVSPLSNRRNRILHGPLFGWRDLADVGILDDIEVSLDGHGGDRDVQGLRANFEFVVVVDRDP